MNIPIVYEFSLVNETEVDKVETKVEGEGEAAKTITVTTKVKEPRPVFFAVKKPNRAERQEMEIVRDAAFKYFIERGIITEGNLRKQYGDNGGVYTNVEEIHYETLREKMRVLVTDYQELANKTTDEDKAKASEIFAEIFDIRRQIIDFEKTANLFYERTAEAKSSKKAVEHYMIYLTYTHGEAAVDKPIDWTPYFKGNTSEEKLAHLSKLEDEGDLNYLRLRDRVMLVCMAMVNNTALTQEQLEEQIKESGLV